MVYTIILIVVIIGLSIQYVHNFLFTHTSWTCVSKKSQSSFLDNVAESCTFKRPDHDTSWHLPLLMAPVADSVS